MEQIDKVINALPVNAVLQINEEVKKFNEQIDEIRIYKDKPLQLIMSNKRISLKGICNGESINNILNNLIKYSYYSYEDDIANGFITIDGGHRVGICGKVVIKNGEIKLIREISSLNIRCSKEIIGCSDELIDYVLTDGMKINNTLIVSPPCCGKTTMLRDLARQISQKGFKVGICDERSEIAGMVNGKASYTFGNMVDVLDGCPKAEGMLMLIRAMSPNVIFTDEIGKPQDIAAINACINCGVNIITTIHGENMNDVMNSSINSIIKNKSLKTIVFLTNVPRTGTIKEVVYV